MTDIRSPGLQKALAACALLRQDGRYPSGTSDSAAGPRAMVANLGPPNTWAASNDALMASWGIVGRTSRAVPAAAAQTTSSAAVSGVQADVPVSPPDLQLPDPAAPVVDAVWLADASFPVQGKSTKAPVADLFAPIETTHANLSAFLHTVMHQDGDRREVIVDLACVFHAVLKRVPAYLKDPLVDALVKDDQAAVDAAAINFWGAANTGVFAIFMNSLASEAIGRFTKWTFVAEGPSATSLLKRGARLAAHGDVGLNADDGGPLQAMETEAGAAQLPQPTPSSWNEKHALLRASRGNLMRQAGSISVAFESYARYFGSPGQELHLISLPGKLEADSFHAQVALERQRVSVFVSNDRDAMNHLRNTEVLCVRLGKGIRGRVFSWPTAAGRSSVEERTRVITDLYCEATETLTKKQQDLVPKIDAARAALQTVRQEQRAAHEARGQLGSADDQDESTNTAQGLFHAQRTQLASLVDAAADTHRKLQQQHARVGNQVRTYAVHDTGPAGRCLCV